MSYGMAPHYEAKINRAFAWIIRNVPNFWYAQNIYQNKLKYKDLTTTRHVEDMRLKIHAIDVYQKETKRDLMSDKFQTKVIRESISINSR